MALVWAEDDMVPGTHTAEFLGTTLTAGYHLLRYKPNYESHEDSQELFMSLVNDPDKFRGESSIVTFLYRSTTNLCLNRLRDRQNRSLLLDLRVSPVAVQASPPAAGLAAGAQQLLAVLPDLLARVVVYAFIDEMTQEEIAEVMQCSRRHVGHLIERAWLLLLLGSKERRA